MIQASERESPGREARGGSLPPYEDAPIMVNRDDPSPEETDLVRFRPAIRFSARITR